MNAPRISLWCFLFTAAAGLWAQNPVLQIERKNPTAGDAWDPRTPLIFTVTLLHPSMRAGASEDDFVLDPPGDWRSAVSLHVTDSTGQPVAWPLVNSPHVMPGPLRLHRLGTASAVFTLDRAGKTKFPLGKYQVRARLAATEGTWRGSVDSPPVSVRVIGREEPRLEVVATRDGALMRGWPLLVGVKLTAPEGYVGGIELPDEEKEWAQAIGLALVDAAGANVALAVERIPLTREELDRSQLRALESRTIWFRAAAESTGALGAGPYRWTAKLTLPPSSNRYPDVWTGTVSAISTPMPVTLPPVPLPADVARRETWARVEDLLLQAKAMRAGTENGYMNARMAVARQSAVPLLNAERIALQWHEAHPDDAGGAVLVATVLAAQEDKVRAVDFVHRAIDIRQRGQAAGGNAAKASSLELQLMARKFEAMPDVFHPVLTPELREGLKQGRAAGAPADPTKSTSSTSSSPTTTATAIASAPASTVTPAPATPPPVVASPATAAPDAVPRTGEPSPGKVVPVADLVDAKIRADAAGQWATSAKAGTQYDRVQYSAAKATGAPDVNVAGNSPDAWCPSTQTQGMDWLEVGFEKPVHAVEVRVRQNDAPGAITKIEAYEPAGTMHLWWEGKDPHDAKGVRDIFWFAVRVPKTTYMVARVKITLNLASGPGYKEIDAVQLVSAP